MKIGLIDAEFGTLKNHSFPNLALMKLSGYYKNLGHEVFLINYSDVSDDFLFTKTYDKIFISKVFTKTFCPEYILKLPNVTYGGTGFFYERSPNLPSKIEHSFPDYTLYDSIIQSRLQHGMGSKTAYKYFLEYSIGYTTRGCFRKCSFCVNKDSDKVVLHSPISEFYDPKRKKICLLDDNFFGCGQHWERILLELQGLKTPFVFKQGLDIRILSEKKSEMLSNCSYDGDFIFAFDSIDDKDLIVKRLKIYNKFTKRKTLGAILYCFCGFDKENKYDLQFWVQDIINCFERIKILMKYHCYPYIMTFDNCNKAPFEFKILYNLVKQWSNGFTTFAKQSFSNFLMSDKINLNKQKVILRFKEKYKNQIDFETYFNRSFNKNLQVNKNEQYKQLF